MEKKDECFFFLTVYIFHYILNGKKLSSISGSIFSGFPKENENVSYISDFNTA